jgi:hypothetical protein
MRRSALLGLFVAMIVVASAAPAAAIVGGDLDGERHPNVALIYFYQPDGRFRCSATLVSPTVLVTAAHCTEGVRGKTIVTFASTAPSPTPRAIDDTGDGQSQTGYTTTPAGWLSGTAHAHPLWDGKLQMNDLHDVGVVVLDQPYTAAAPQPLPPRNYLESLASTHGGLGKEEFDLVGYGVFYEKPAEGPQKAQAVSDRTRRYTTGIGQTLSSQVLQLQASEKDSRAGGGTCFGDSGGAAMHGGYLVGDTSYTASQFCKGMGGYYRLDTDDARSFLDDYVTVP